MLVVFWVSMSFMTATLARLFQRPDHATDQRGLSDGQCHLCQRLTRQSGLMREMRTIANNIANANTTGFRREGVIFSEYMAAGRSSWNAVDGEWPRPHCRSGTGPG